MKKLFFLILMLLWQVAFTQSEWELIYGDSNFSVGNVFMIDTNHIWGTTGQLIYFSSDGGDSWEEQFYHPDYSFFDVFFADSLNGWVVGWSEVLNTDDGGKTWTLQTLPNPMGMDVNAVYFINSDTGWIAGSYKTIYGTYDGGENWISLHDYQITGHVWLNDIHFIDELHGCAVGGKTLEDEPLIMTTLDGGKTWSEFIPLGTTSEMKSVQYVNEFIVWACDREGMIFNSWDKGITWETINFIGNLYPKGMHFFNEYKSFIAGSMGHNVLTSDAWVNYHLQELYYVNSISCFSFDEDGCGIASGHGNVLTTNNEGQDWGRVNDRFVGISFFDPMNGWIVQEHLNKNFMHTNDGGYTWTEVDAGNQGYLLQMDFISDQLGFAITKQSEFLKTLDAGMTWELLYVPYTDIHFAEIQFINQDVGFLCAHPNLVLKTLNGGVDWEMITVDQLNYISGADFMSASEAWLVDNTGAVAHTTDAGTSWEISYLGSNSLSDIDFVNDEHGYVISSPGIAYRTSDGGDTWEDMGLNLNSPQIIHFHDMMNGWITDKSMLYKTKNGGDSWEVMIDVSPASLYNQLTGFYALDTALAWTCTMDGRVFSKMNTTGEKELPQAVQFNIYPNPASTEIYVRSSFFGARSSVFIYDMFGRQQEEIQIPADQDQVRIDVSEYPAGIYIAVLKNEKGIEGRRKFVVK